MIFITVHASLKPFSHRMNDIQFHWVVRWLMFVFAGDMFEIGADSGRYYSLNIPLKEGMDDSSKYYVMYSAVCEKNIVQSVMEELKDLTGQIYLNTCLFKSTYNLKSYNELKILAITLPMYDVIKVG